MTAFNVQSYPLLQPAAADTTNVILADISAQLQSFRINPTFINSTQSSFDAATETPFTAPRFAIVLNALWFTSLVFSLASATIGIIVKQWLKEYNSGLYGASRDVARRRQYRYENMKKWHVATIVALVPFLLLVAAVLFLAGLLVLLYNINNIVAVVVSIFVGLLLLFVVFTTILPTLSHTCCYYSPQARAFVAIRNAVTYAIARTLGPPIAAICGLFERRPDLPGYFKIAWRYLERLQREVLPPWRVPRVWRGDEHALVPANSVKLDTSIMVTAYSAALDINSLDQAIICLTDGASEDFWKEYLSNLKAVLNHYYGSLQDLWPRAISDRFAKTTEIARRLSMALTSGLVRNDGDPQSSQDLINAVKTQLEEPETSRDERTRLKALSTMSREVTLEEAERVWGELYWDNDIQAPIRDSVTYRTGEHRKL